MAKIEGKCGILNHILGQLEVKILLNDLLVGGISAQTTLRQQVYEHEEGHEV